jgi:hypothetical protein
MIMGAGLGLSALVMMPAAVMNDQLWFEGDDGKYGH